MRLFVALQLSDELKKIITGTLHDLKKQGVKGSYVPAQNLHLTLAFIGETKDTEAVKAALRTIKFKPFKLTLSETGYLNDHLYIGLKGNQGLSSAAKAVRDALDAAGIDYDRKKFLPHITIVRSIKGNRQQIPAPSGTMTVEKISLMKSAQQDGRRVYTEIFSV